MEMEMKTTITTSNLGYLHLWTHVEYACQGFDVRPNDGLRIILAELIYLLITPHGMEKENWRLSVYGKIAFAWADVAIKARFENIVSAGFLAATISRSSCLW